MTSPAFDRSTLSRALFSSDASLYRVVPRAVCRPGSAEQLPAVLAAARAEGLPVTARGRGTSCAGNAVGPGLVLDLTALDRIVEVDPERRLAVVEPGVVQADLQAIAGRHGLRYGPDPATASRCTIGGMLGNNACGPRALGLGRTADTVLGVDVVLADGERLALSGAQRGPTHPRLAALEQLVLANLGVIRTEFGRFSRQASGYALEHLLPENGFDVARFLVGSEGTLALVERATLRLTHDEPHRVLVVLGYPSMAEAADAVPEVLRHRPTACEGLDGRIVAVVAERRGSAAVPELPRGAGWLLVEVAGDVAGEVAQRAEALARSVSALAALVIYDRAHSEAWWRLRTDGAGLSGLALGRPAHAGWEDAAVPPERLGSYLRDFEALLFAHGLHALPYGHFGEGCVHCRIDFPLTAPDGRQRYRRFVEAAADLVAAHGGSLSGEHGDGRARSELLPRIYSPAALRLFSQVKHLFDPDNLLNPGVLVDPEPVDLALRARGVAHAPLALAHPAFSEAVHRCIGVGSCLSPDGAMCPSYQATGKEVDGTRGRARILQEMVNGSLVRGRWRSPEVHQALDLCLACKACAVECPAGVDIARHRSEVLHEAFRGRRRPLAHHTLGALPRWSRWITAIPGLAALANALLAAPGPGRWAARLAGVDPRRRLPRFRTDPLPQPAPAGGGRVAVWVDSFARCFQGGQVEAVLTVLERAGYRPELVAGDACCGLTWISTGQHEVAAGRLRRALDVLHPLVAAGVPVVGLEPSCLAVWRDEAPRLVDDPRVAAVAAGVSTLAELLARTDGWQPPDLSGRTLVVQPHCHHHAVLGWQADAALLARTGANVTTVTGCCGLAGDFGMTADHRDVSVAVAGLHLLPALTAALEARVVADGFSCRTQVADLTGRRAVTLAELLAQPEEMGA